MKKKIEVANIIEILQIIEKAKVLHLALFDADYPYIVHFTTDTNMQRVS